MKENSETKKETKQYTKGHFVATGTAIGIPLGMPIGLAIGNIALGPVIGVFLGIVIGYALENRYNKHPLPLTAKQEKQKKRFTWIALGIGEILLLAVLIVYVNTGQ